MRPLIVLWIVGLALVRQETTVDCYWLLVDVAVPPANFTFGTTWNHEQSDDSLTSIYSGTHTVSRFGYGKFTQSNPGHCDSALNNDCVLHQQCPPAPRLQRCNGPGPNQHREV